jgi:hypothetical protein
MRSRENKCKDAGVVGGTRGLVRGAEREVQGISTGDPKCRLEFRTVGSDCLEEGFRYKIYRFK